MGISEIITEIHISVLDEKDSSITDFIARARAKQLFVTSLMIVEQNTLEQIINI